MLDGFLKWKWHFKLEFVFEKSIFKLDYLKLDKLELFKRNKNIEKKIGILKSSERWHIKKILESTQLNQKNGIYLKFNKIHGFFFKKSWKWKRHFKLKKQLEFI